MLRAPVLVTALTAALLLTAPVRAEVPDILQTSPSAERFGLPPTLGRPRLSPDGSKMLFLQQNGLGVGVVSVIDFATGKVANVGAGSEEGYDIGWCEWVNNSRLICDLVFAADADGSNFKMLEKGKITRPPERVRLCGVAAEARARELNFDTLPEAPEYFGWTCGRRTRIDTYTGKTEALGIGNSRETPGAVMSDGHGVPRLQRDGSVGQGYDRWYVHEDYDAEWVLFHESNPVRFEDPFRPVGFGANVNVLFHLAWDSKHWALYGLDTQEPKESQLLFSHPELDIELVDVMGPYDRVVAAAFLDGRPQRFVVDQQIANVYQSARAIFPGQNLEVVDESWDHAVDLLLVREPRRAGNFYRANLAEGTVALVGPEHAQLADVDLAETRTLSLPGNDGEMVSGHLTLPDDHDAPGPAVIIPRGFPSRLDVADPHYLVQYLAANGYAVLRLNYRGAPEYGGWLPERAALGWRQAADDIQAASRYLVSEGIAEPGRICTLGRDFGAYAALMNAVAYPGEMACVVSIGGVMDPGAIVARDMTGIGAMNNALREGSPIRRVDEIAAPVLLFHGGFDGVVPMLGQSSYLYQALDGAGKDVEYIEYEFARHAIARAPYRIDMLSRIGTFLGERIGGATGQPVD